MWWIGHIININLVLHKIIVSTQIHRDTYTTVGGTAAPPPHPFDGSVLNLFWVYLHIGYVLNGAHY